MTRSLTLMFLIGLCLACATVPAWGAPPSYTKEDVFNAWLDRQRRVATAVFIWTERRHELAGSLSDPLPEPMRPPQRLPAEDTVVEITDIALYLKASKLRYNTELRGSRLPDHGGARKPHQSAFDGAVNTSFYHPPGDPIGNASIESSYRASDATSVALRPLLFALRPLDQHILAIDPDEYDLGSSEIVDGHECVQFIRHADTPYAGAQDYFWLDPDRDFIPVRFVHQFRGDTTVEIDMEYAPDVESGWVPARWRWIMLSTDGAVTEAADGLVTSYELNLPLPDELFRIRFPAGTRISDRDSGEEYALTADGRKRILSNWGDPDPLGERTPPARRRRLGPLVAFNAAGVALVMLGMYLWRRRRAAARAGSASDENARTTKSTADPPPDA